MAHKTYIRDVDDGISVVLFIHGFLGSTEQFGDFILRLPDEYGIYNILLDGHGGSVRDFAHTSMEKWKMQIDKVMQNLVKKYKNIIIVGHSMGTFFAMDSALKYKENVKGIILLQTPLKIGVKPTAFLNTFKSLFDLISDDDYVGKAYKNSHSVKLTLRFWEYIGWIPRYLELFIESVVARETIKKVDVPCSVYQSVRDELVSLKSLNFIPDNHNIDLKLLDKSRHFIYEKSEKEMLIKEFLEFCEEKTN